jgi:hypothetical protein
MLDGFIIEELKRREQERARKDRQRPVLELPLPSHEVNPEGEPREDWRNDENERPDPRKRKPETVVHIDLLASALTAAR